MSGDSGSEQVTPPEIRYQDIRSQLEEWVNRQISEGRESDNLGGWKGPSGKRYDVLNREWTGLGNKPGRNIFIVATDRHPETGGLETWRYVRGIRPLLSYRKTRVERAKQPLPGRELETHTIEGGGYNENVQARTRVNVFEKFDSLLQDLGTATRFPPPST